MKHCQECMVQKTSTKKSRIQKGMASWTKLAKRARRDLLWCCNRQSSATTCTDKISWNFDNRNDNSYVEPIALIFALTLCNRTT